MIRPLVSVVMPTNGRIDYCLQAVNSILAQTIQNFELLIVNNASNFDDLARVLPKDSRIKHFKFANGGVVARSRNHGIRNSSGRYIAFCDDDDLWCENKLQVQLDALKASDIGFACFSVDRFGDGVCEDFGHRDIAHGSVIPGKLTLFRLILKNSICLSSVMLERDYVTENFFFDDDPRISPFEDYLKWIEICSIKKNVIFINRPLVRYRISGSQHTRELKDPHLIVIRVLCRRYKATARLSEKIMLTMGIAARYLRHLYWLVFSK